MLLFSFGDLKKYPLWEYKKSLATLFRDGKNENMGNERLALGLLVCRRLQSPTTKSLYCYLFRQLGDSIIHYWKYQSRLLDFRVLTWKKAKFQLSIEYPKPIRLIRKKHIIKMILKSFFVSNCLKNVWEINKDNKEIKIETNYKIKTINSINSSIWSIWLSATSYCLKIL